MPVSKKKDPAPAPAENTVVLYDVAANATKREKAAVVNNKYTRKDTLNLCMREKSVITLELFFLLFAVILAFLVLVEYVGIYRPYRAVEQAEAALAANRAELQAVLDKMSDYDEKQKMYNEYNFENYDVTIVDRNTILDFVDRTVFAAGGKLKSFRLVRNELTMSVIGLELNDVSNLYADMILEDELVSAVTVSTTGYENTDGGVPTANITVRFKDATLGG